MRFKRFCTILFILILLQSVEIVNVKIALSDESNGIILTTYREKYQDAFSVLIPKGWRAEGGMISSGVSWNVVDLVESNIRFRVTSPDGRSFFGWYPKFYFQDPQVFVQSSGGTLQPQIGQVLNGCWIYPYLNVAQYVQYIVFGKFAANEFHNPQFIGEFAQSPELKAFVPHVASRSDYGYVNFKCHVNNIATYGRMYSINYELQGAIWSTVGTFGLLAPQSRWKTDERIMEICIRSFRLNPAWVKKASSAAQHRAQQYHRVIQDINRIDSEISRNRAQTNSDIQEEFYKVITEQIETYDPVTKNKRYLPMYNNAYTDGKGNYYLNDHDDGTLPFDNASEWRKLQIINRNDPNQ
ncbi:MAG: hypothetical protein KJO26_13310 [Deltaproteobacteria bacterium]|nr:hypothetical protein [Deltaproteobacteria bacterium]